MQPAFWGAFTGLNAKKKEISNRGKLSKTCVFTSKNVYYFFTLLKYPSALDFTCNTCILESPSTGILISSRTCIQCIKRSCF